MGEMTWWEKPRFEPMISESPARCISLLSYGGLQVGITTLSYTRVSRNASAQVCISRNASAQVRISTFLYLIEYQGSARTQSPTNRNCTPESPAFGVIAKVNLSVVQWKGLTLGEPPRGSRFPLCQVSMLDQPVNLPFLVSPSLEMMGCNFQTFTCRKINILT